MGRPLSVAIDVSAIPREPRGAGRYVVELVRHLDRGTPTRLRLLARRDDAPRWTSIAPQAEVEPIVPVSRAARLVWEQTSAARRVNAWPVDAYHGPHYTMPAGVRVPRLVTVHDLTFFDHPEWHERRKVAFFRRAIRLAAERADQIICVSHATQRRLEELLRPVVPVCVIPHGIDHSRFTADPQASDAALRAEVGAVGRYLLFVGTMEPRKNVAGLVAAFDRLAEEGLRLVLAGGRGWDEGELEKAIERSPNRERIIRTGYVPDDTVPALLRGAAAVVYPAFVEGFGLPVLEALACGAPVVTTEGSVMDELADGVAITATAGDITSLVAAIEAALAGAGERREAGLDVARRYTWDAAAAAHVEAYERVRRDPL